MPTTPRAGFETWTASTPTALTPHTQTPGEGMPAFSPLVDPNSTDPCKISLPGLAAADLNQMLAYTSSLPSLRNRSQRAESPLKLQQVHSPVNYSTISNSPSTRAKFVRGSFLGGFIAEAEALDVAERGSRSAPASTKAQPRARRAGRLDMQSIL